MRSSIHTFEVFSVPDEYGTSLLIKKVGWYTCWETWTPQRYI